MENLNLLLKYYLIKRIFLFMDEWLFYLVLYSLVYLEFYKISIIILLYGLACIYTSYSNLDKLEQKLVGIKQNIFLFII